MKNFISFIALIICCLYGFSQSFSVDAGSRAYQTSFNQPATGVYELTFDIADASVTSVELDGVVYDKINFPVSTVTGQKGWAALPFVSASVQLPADKDVRLEVEPVSYRELVLAHPLVPSRGTIYRNQDPAQIPYEIAPESRVNAFYPGNVAAMEEPFIVRDVRGTTVRCYPFQYNAVTNTLRIYTRVKVTLTEVSGAATNPLLNASAQPVREVIGMYQSMFINYAPTRQDLAQGERGEILVLTTSAYESAADTYIQWKREMGYTVTKQVVNNGANVVSTIRTAYNDNNNILYVQMFGDWANIKSDASVDSSPTDPKMGCVAGNDNYPDIAIGRFSCSSAAQALVQVNKAIRYEKEPDMDAGWRETFIGIGSSEGSGQGDDNEIDYDHVKRIYTERLQTFTYNNHLQNYGDNASANTLLGHVNQGASTIAYCGHGAETYFVTTGFSNSNVNSLTNGNHLPFIVSVACVNGAFHNSSDCFAEAWLKKENGGAVVTLMSTINQPWTPPQRGQDYFYDILIGGFNYNQYSGQSGINTNEQRTHWGSIVINAFNLMLSESSTTDDIETVQTWSTFGDASLQLRTKQPDAISLSNDAIMVGIPFTTTVTSNGSPVENALVCISQNDVYYSGYTDASGNVTITQDFAAGEVLLVVTAFNTATIYETVPCMAGNVPYVMLDSYSPHIVDAGAETFLTITMRNAGGVATTGNTTVVLTSDDSRISILHGSDIFGVMAANGGTATVSNGYRILVDDAVSSGTVIPINFTATCGQDTWQGIFNLTVRSANCVPPTGLVATASGNNVTVTWDDDSSVELVSLSDDAESHTHATINSAGTMGWTYIDGDGANTGTFQNISYTNSGSPMAFIVLDMSQATGNGLIQAHSGNKFFACPYARSSGYWGSTVQNDDWMISPELNFSTPFNFSFYARSFSSQYSSEQFYAAYSTTGNSASDFVALTSSPVTTTTTWTEYSYTVPANAKYVAIHCVSNDQYIFCVDDITISGQAVEGTLCNIYRNGELIAENLVGGTYTDNNLPEGTYCYTMTTACDNDFESDFSSNTCVTVGNPSPEECNVPTGLYVSVSSNQLGLSWDAVPNALSYKVYRNGNIIATTATNSYTDADVQNNMVYAYAVQTVCNGGESGISQTVSAQTGVGDYASDQVQVYPNPARNVIQVAGRDIREISVYSAIGGLMVRLNPTEEITPIHVNEWSNGIYFVKVTTADGTVATEKVVVKK
ncbi:MAG: choice-of-anchor J domain-containing protein [Bacteroidales bacterium]|nr:choice-of-anchor J domain-containing protein [Bacteroidales bacterium]